MLAALLKSHAKHRFNPSHTDCQLWCRDNKVVKVAPSTFGHLADTLFDILMQLTRLAPSLLNPKVQIAAHCASAIAELEQRPLPTL
jgi:hypothetical protein